MSRGKIAFLIRSLGVGGAERQLVELAKGLRGVGRDVVVLTFYPDGAMATELDEAGVRRVVVGKRHRWDVLGFVWRLAAELRRERAAILHGYMPDANILVTLLGRLLRRRRVVWGVRASRVDLSHYDRVSAVVLNVARRLARGADLIICNSRAGAADHVAQGYPADRVLVVPNGIDTRRFRPDPGARARLRSEWGIPEGAPLIGLVGRLDPMKDHRTFLRAAAALRREHPAARFVFVGRGADGYVAELAALAAELGLADRLMWAAPRQDVTAVFAALDVLTLCSAFGEGFPNVVGEAMACGTPCVVTDVGDAAWIVGDTGRVVPVGDADALARAWAELLPSVGCAALAERCRARIVGEFGLDALVRNTEAALARLEPCA
jgi:glycosyltransferase involved in cell wall biosynthesis